MSDALINEVVCGSLFTNHVGPESRRLTAINAHYRLSNKLDIRLFMNGVLLFYHEFYQ